MESKTNKNFLIIRDKRDFFRDSYFKIRGIQSTELWQGVVEAMALQGL